MKSMTKTQLFSFFKENPATLTPLMRRMVRNCANLRELREELKYTADKYYSLKAQSNRDIRWHAGETYFIDDQAIDGVLSAVHELASLMGYEVYSPNGAWFVRAK